MQVKKNLFRRKPTEDEIKNLTFPKDKFELISFDYVDEWDQHKINTSKEDPNCKNYVYRKKSCHITLKCKKCGTIKSRVTDTPYISCKTGPCMSTWVDLTGKRFGKLVVLKLDHRKITKRNSSIWYWLCKCDCGGTCYKKSSDLISHYHRMCTSCSRKEAIHKSTLPQQLSKWHRMLRVYKKNAMTFKREFLLDDEEFIRLSKLPCSYCGSPPVENSYGVVSNGIDRIDSSKGYVPGNVTSCCKYCNLMKSKLSTNDFLHHIKRIYDHSILNSKLNDHPKKEYASSGAEMGIGQ